MFLRMTCGNSLFEQFQDFDGFEKGTLADLQKITRLEFAGRFGGSVVHLHPVSLAGIRCKSSGPEMSGGPKPPVQSAGVCDQRAVRVRAVH